MKFISKDKEEKTEQNKEVNIPDIGLVLGSGLARGFAHIGVIRALVRNGIKPSIVAGTSMGALIGGAYCADKLDEVEEWALSLTKLKIFSYLDFKIKSHGIIGGDRLFKKMQSTFGEIMTEDLPIPLIAVATDIITGHEIWLRQGKLIDVMRASFSMPGVFPPVLLEERWLMDGALSNPVPVSACTNNDARMTIAVNVNGDTIGKSKKYSTNRAPKSVIPSMINIVQTRLARSRMASDPADIMIVPRIGEYDLMDFHRARDLIAAGEEEVEKMLPDIEATRLLLCGD